MDFDHEIKKQAFGHFKSHFQTQINSSNHYCTESVLNILKEIYAYLYKINHGNASSHVIISDFDGAWSAIDIEVRVLLDSHSTLGLPNTTSIAIQSKPKQGTQMSPIIYRLLDGVLR
jgi:hypothetical protein